MTKVAFESALKAYLSRQPYRPFTIALRSGSCIEIDHPADVTMRDGLVISKGPGQVTSYFDHDSVVQLMDWPPSDVPAIVISE